MEEGAVVEPDGQEQRLVADDDMGAGSKAADGAALAGKRTLVVQVQRAMIGQGCERVASAERPPGSAPGRQHGPGGGLKQQIDMRVADAFVREDGVPQSAHVSSKSCDHGGGGDVGAGDFASGVRATHKVGRAGVGAQAPVVGVVVGEAGQSVHGEGGRGEGTGGFYYFLLGLEGGGDAGEGSVHEEPLAGELADGQAMSVGVLAENREFLEGDGGRELAEARGVVIGGEDGRAAGAGEIAELAAGVLLKEVERGLHGVGVSIHDGGDAFVAPADGWAEEQAIGADLALVAEGV